MSVTAKFVHPDFHETTTEAELRCEAAGPVQNEVYFAVFLTASWQTPKREIGLAVKERWHLVTRNMRWRLEVEE